MTEAMSLTPTMMVVLGLLAFTVFLFVTEIVRVDVAAVLVMVLLGLLTLVPGLEKLTDAKRLFEGFASNAVISIIAVMIIGAGLDKTGMMGRLAGMILRVGGRTERRLIPLISGTVGLISSFMQNVGAAALFLPVVARISARSGLPMSRLLMPMGYCAILGGTVTLVGSSPLILLNDLLPPGIPRFKLFEVTPIGLALLATGILYFVIAGRYVLPSNNTPGARGADVMGYFRRLYGLDLAVIEARVAPDSRLASRLVGEIEEVDGVHVIAALVDGTPIIAPPRDVAVEAGTHLVIMVERARQVSYLNESGLTPKPELDIFNDLLAPTRAGVCEVVIPTRSRLIGHSLRELWMRKTYGLAVLAIHRGRETLREGLRDVELQPGDTLVCHNTWETLARIDSDRDFVVVTTEYPHEEERPHKLAFALFFFALAIGLVLFSPLRLSLSLMVGAIGMVLSGVLHMDEAYKAVDWKTVFLLAALIPLGMSMEQTGTAAWIAAQALHLLDGAPLWAIEAVVAVLATVFSLVMSNVGATVLLVPLAISMAVESGGDPRLFALIVGLATSNSFIIPTHQVNALILGPGGYRVKDFLRAGGIMSVLFLVVMLLMLNLVF
ncbi:potassium transporter TrkA [Acidihalobacter yilgarnensis]|uniref:Potassium transporter TrkA n=1 Tax=Acidihalobacter yilgarnensis TaxID=2819280 RepID=A0A1D8IS64_9GAMM|nr:SLC13 family permease [Acidihalobacter yilgarnensis]AOU99247.1 potassium transporter TrkA [Acidihalobacter yilgarnensis]